MGEIAEKIDYGTKDVRDDARSADNAPESAAVAEELSLAATLQPIHGAHVTISGASDGAYEVLMYDLTGTGILASHATSADGAQQDLYLFNKADRAVYEAVLRGIRYSNRAPEPTPGVRHVKIDITDATAFAEPVYAATLDVIAPVDVIAPTEQAYDLLAPDLLRQTAENIQFAAFEFAPLGTVLPSYSDVWAAPNAGDDLFADEGTTYTLFEQAAGGLADRGADLGREETSLAANGHYLVFSRQAVIATTAQSPGDADLLDGREYRMFRERQQDGTGGSDAATLLVQDPESGAWFSAPAISQISDTAPVIAINDSETRRRFDAAEAAFRQAA